MVHKFTILLMTTLILSFSATNFTSASERSVTVCAKKLEDISVRRGYYAFALSAARDHCGWSWNKDSINHAQFTAMKGCKNRKGVNCKIVRSGCEPYKKNKCGKR